MLRAWLYQYKQQKTQVNCFNYLLSLLSIMLNCRFQNPILKLDLFNNWVRAVADEKIVDLRKEYIFRN